MAVGLKMPVLAMICTVVLPAPCFAQIPELGRGKMPTLAPLVREITPSVVNISVYGRVKEDNPYRDPLLREYFDAPKQLEREIQGIGSGAIVDGERGYVLTANQGWLRSPLRR
jgi:serine protease Do